MHSPAYARPLMAPVMERTRHPGIYKRGSRYVVVWRHRGRQHKTWSGQVPAIRQ